MTRLRNLIAVALLIVFTALSLSPASASNVKASNGSDVYQPGFAYRLTCTTDVSRDGATIPVARLQVRFDNRRSHEAMSFEAVVDAVDEAGRAVEPSTMKGASVGAGRRSHYKTLMRIAGPTNPAIAKLTLTVSANDARLTTIDVGDPALFCSDIVGGSTYPYKSAKLRLRFGYTCTVIPPIVSSDACTRRAVTVKVTNRGRKAVRVTANSWLAADYSVNSALGPERSAKVKAHRAKLMTLLSYRGSSFRWNDERFTMVTILVTLGKAARDWIGLQDWRTL